jgi:DNA-3-methyladenine glycosylase
MFTSCTASTGCSISRPLPPKNLTQAGPVPGPGRVTKLLRITGALSGVDAVESDRIWIEDRGVRVTKRDMVSGPRVGIDFAGPYWASKPWRFRLDPAGAAPGREMRGRGSMR